MRLPGEGMSCLQCVGCALFLLELQPASWQAEAVTAQVISLKNGLQAAQIDVV